MYAEVGAGSGRGRGVAHVPRRSRYDAVKVWKTDAHQIMLRHLSSFLDRCRTGEIRPGTKSHVCVCVCLLKKSVKKMRAIIRRGVVFRGMCSGLSRLCHSRVERWFVFAIFTLLCDFPRRNSSVGVWCSVMLPGVARVGEISRNNISRSWLKHSDVYF